VPLVRIPDRQQLLRAKSWPQPCFGGVSGGGLTPWWRDPSQTEIVGAGKLENGDGDMGAL